MESKISPGLSLYLDAVRFVAALAVVLYHTWGLFYPATTMKFPGHEAVVVFFVLSGFVIAHATARPGVTWSSYTQHRCARILPMAYAALLLGVVAALLVPPVSDAADPIWAPLLANMVFMAQSAHISLNPAHNEPMWSLNYEVWYYVIFGLWLYAPRRWRLWLVGGAALLAGPKILLLLPVWLYGVWLYHHMPRLSKLLAWTVFVLSVVLIGYTTAYDVSSMIRSELYRVFPPAWRLHYSTQFIYDLLLGLVVMANFTAVSALSQGVTGTGAYAAVVRYLAGFTFTLYVFHKPLVPLLREVLQLRSAAPFYLAMALAMFVLVHLFERRTAFFRALFARIGRRPLAVAT